jgi:RNA polymerase sigma factor (TIGR02999 family)
LPDGRAIAIIGDEQAEARGSHIMKPTDTVSRLSAAVRGGDRVALEDLVPSVYAELHRLASAFMRRERPGHTLQPTALVNEAYLRLADRDATWEDRRHFVGVAAHVMRSVLVDHARARAAAKRDGGARVTLDGKTIGVDARELDLLALDEALERLELLDPGLARVVELKYFGGMTTKETAAVMEVSVATVEREWATARGWLKRELTREVTP